MTDSMAYHNENAEAFFAESARVDMSALQERFLRRIEPGGLILDAGCGSGRDFKAFLSRGFQVLAFDASRELAELASRHLDQPVAVKAFSNIAETAGERVLRARCEPPNPARGPGVREETEFVSPTCAPW